MVKLYDRGALRLLAATERTA